MFLTRRPSQLVIDRFLRDSQDLQLSYGRIGIVRDQTPSHPLDEAIVAIGRGKADFDRARAALTAWKQFDIGWVEICLRRAPVGIGTGRRGAHPPSRVLVPERLPRSLQRRFSGWCSIRFRVRDADKPRRSW
jgi:hypothetical protein